MFEVVSLNFYPGHLGLLWGKIINMPIYEYILNLFVRRHINVLSKAMGSFSQNILAYTTYEYILQQVIHISS